MNLEIFDVEHGQCALLTHGNGNRILIDCGHNSTTGWTPGKHLQSLGVRSLSKLVITNYDEDHVSGLIDLEQRINVEWLLRNPSVDGLTLRTLKSEDGMGQNIEYLAGRVGSFVPSNNPEPDFPGVVQEYYWNTYPGFDDENNLSVVYVLRVHNTVFIFPGDMECAGWENVLAGQLGLRQAVGDCHVLVASHHGRESGICDKMFTHYGCKPQVIIISDDYRQFETQNTTNYYREKCSGIPFRQEPRRVLTTRSDGKISFVWSALGGCYCY